MKHFPTLSDRINAASSKPLWFYFYPKMLRLGCNYLFKHLSYSIRLRASWGRNLNCLLEFNHGRSILIQGNFMLLSRYYWSTLTLQFGLTAKHGWTFLRWELEPKMNLWLRAKHSAGVNMISVPVLSLYGPFCRHSWEAHHWFPDGHTKPLQEEKVLWKLELTALDASNTTPGISVLSLLTHVSQEGSPILSGPEVWL